MRILNQYEEDSIRVTEYTKDGITASHIIRKLIQTESTDPYVPQPPIEEEILFETKYQTMILEMGGM